MKSNEFIKLLKQRTNLDENNANELFQDIDIDKASIFIYLDILSGNTCVYKNIYII